MSHQKKRNGNSRKQKKSRKPFRGQETSPVRTTNRTTEFGLKLKSFLMSTEQTHIIPK